MLKHLKLLINKLGRTMVDLTTIESEKDYIERKIADWKQSPERLAQIQGEQYYKGEHDILKRRRQVVGSNGSLIEVYNLPNNHIVDNQFAKMVDQKKNYLLSQPVVFNSDNKAYAEILKDLFNKRFMKTIKDVGLDCIVGGIGWIHPYYDEEGNFKFKKFPAYEILPFWDNKEHTKLKAAIRYYLEEERNDKTDDVVEKVEIYTHEGIFYYTLKNGKLKADQEHPHKNYLTLETEELEQGYNWDRIPLVPFKFNAFEIPLLTRCKNIQDAINTIMSDFVNSMEENAGGNSIIVLENYDGENLEEFREKLATLRAVKVASVDGMKGDVRKLEIEVNSANYQIVLKELKRQMIENCRGFDIKDERMSTNPNQMNIKSMYADIDLDSYDMESEFESSFNDLFWFVNKYLSNSGQGNFDGEDVEIIFNRDFVVNEIEVLNTLIQAGVRISNKTLLKQVPFIDSIEDELTQLKQEESSQLDIYNNAFPNKEAVNDNL